MKNLFTALLILVCISSFAQEVEKRKVMSKEIDKVFEQWKTSDKPGIVVGILNNGQIEYTQGYGLANVEHQISMTPETKVHIGDLAKEFTAYAILLLEQRGQLSLQDDVRKHISSLKEYPNTVTIKQLLHHTAGLNSLEVSKALAGWKSGDVFTITQAHQLIEKQANSAPKSGSIQLRSDAGFMLLEELISKVSETSYAQFVTKEIFEPLGMTNTIFDTNGNIISNKAEGYFPQGNSFRRTSMNHTQTIVSDVYTTVRDMLLWAKELSNPKVGNAAMMQKFDALSEVNGKKVEESNTALYTGGHGFWDYRGAKKLYHIEVAGGYASKLIRYPDYDLAVVVLGNDGAYNGYAATGASELYLRDFLDPILENNPKIKSKRLSNKKLTLFEGNYWDIGSHASRKIELVKDTLRYVRGPGNESPLVPLTNHTFKMITRGDVKVTFNKKASSTSIEVDVAGETFHLIKYDPNANWAKNLNNFTGSYYCKTLDVSYTLFLTEGKLVLKHPRLDAVNLSPKIPNVFAGDKPHYASIKFKRNDNGDIIGFQLATRGVTNLWFTKDTTANNSLAKN